MSYKHKNLDDRIAEALKTCASSFLRPGNGRWELSLSNGKELPVTLRLANDWLLFDAPVSDRITREDLWRVLNLNSSFSGFCKLILTPRRSVHLRAEVPLSDQDSGFDEQDTIESNLEASLGRTCSSLKTAFGIFQGAAPEPAAQTGPGEDRVEELRRVCAELEWPFIERSAGKLMFQLEDQNGFHQAVVEQQHSGARLSVEILRFDDLKPLSRQALGALLLITGAHVRMARSSVDEHSTGRFEVSFAALPAVNELKHALSSLSVACAMCAEEALILRDENIAQQYLAYTGLSESPTNFSLPVSYQEASV